MAEEEFELDLDQLDSDINKKNKVQERIIDLSSKVKTASEEREAAQKAASEAEAGRKSAEQERDFFKDFSGLTATYQGASEFQEEILGKVKSGYTVEDATVSVLNSKGRLNQQTEAPKPVERETAAGGSANNTMSQGGVKPVNEMTRDEKRSALLEAQARGDLDNR